MNGRYTALSQGQRKGQQKARGLWVPKERARECQGEEITYKETGQSGRADSRWSPADHSYVALEESFNFKMRGLDEVISKGP